MATKSKNGTAKGNAAPPATDSRDRIMLNMQITRERKRRLRAMAKATGKTMTEMVSDFIDDAVERGEKSGGNRTARRA